MSEPSASQQELAAQRTVLANERTLLAYVRTAIALVAAGASSIHFLEGPAFEVLGWALVGAGLVAQAVGVIRYRRVRALLKGGSGAVPGER